MATTGATLASMKARATRTYELVGGKWRYVTFGGKKTGERYAKVRIFPAHPPLAARELSLGIVPGRRVRIPYKRAGTWGTEWHAFIRDEQGRSLWSGRCDKSTGAGVILGMIGLK